jgi:hypothetical protein
LYGSETGSLTLREELRLRVFVDGLPREICGLKKDEMIIVFSWRKLHNEELNNLLDFK